MNRDSQEKRTLRFLKENWMGIVFIAGLIVTWTNLKNTQANSQERITSLETKVASVDASQNEILVQLSQIQTDVSWLRKESDLKK